MGGAVEAIADIGGDIISSAADVGSIVTDLGAEFITPETLGVASLAFGVPGADVLNFGGFDLVGSFAGDAAWFDAFNPGAILNNIPSVGDFNIGSITDSLPSLSSIASSVPSVSDFQGYVRTAQTTIAQVAPITQQVQNIAGYAGIQLPGTQILNTAAGAVSLASSGLNVAAGATNAITGIVGQAQSLVATNGIVGGTFRELSNAELAQVTRNVNPLFINSLVDPGTGQPLNYNTAVEGRTALTPLVAEVTNNIAQAQSNIASNNANIAAIEAELRDETLPDDRRELLEEFLQVNYENNAIQQNTISASQQILASATPNLAADQQIITNTNATATQSPAPVVDSSTPILVNQTTSGVSLGAINTSPGAVATPVNLGTVTATDLGLAVDPGPFAEGSSARNLVAEARAQQSARAVRNNKAESSDWRVRLRLAPNSTYLYNAPGNPGDPASGPGIMAPLTKTDGVIFPYTPSIDTAYKANYETYDLTHSNYRGYFYKGSYVDAVNIRAQFTAQDTNEANYLLAVIHFFRSATKMFYGKDQQRGAPPPLVYLSGYGDYQFNEHPSVISQFNYTLPPDVDYIRAQSALDVNANLLGNRIRNPIANNPLSYTVNRLLNSNLLPGALDFRPNIANNLPLGSPTYVPTKMEISITLLPIQSRQQISKNFSVKTFAAGNLLKGGYW